MVTPAGALTDSGDLARQMRMVADHGSPRKYEHQVPGVNSRLDTLQAVVLSAKAASARQVEFSPTSSGRTLRHAIVGLRGNRPSANSRGQ